jgi:hypothetical protein
MEPLEKYRKLSRREGFPNDRDIKSGLTFIHCLSQKLDAFSLLHACYANTQAIEQLFEKIKTLAAFYSDEAQRWEMFVQFAKACKNTISGNIEEPSVAAAFERFEFILSLPQPYDRVDEAWQLYQSLKPCHDKIVAQQTEQCRQAALSKMASLVREMKTHLDAHGADADLRNQALFSLRVKVRSINDSKNIHRIKIHAQAAEEVFEAFWDEVAGP